MTARMAGLTACLVALGGWAVVGSTGNGAPADRVHDGGDAGIAVDPALEPVRKALGLWQRRDLTALARCARDPAPPALGRFFCAYFEAVETGHWEQYLATFPRTSDDLVFLWDWDRRLQPQLGNACPDPQRPGCDPEAPKAELVRLAAGGNRSAVAVFAASWLTHPGDGGITDEVCDLAIKQILKKRPAALLEEAARAIKPAGTLVSCVESYPASVASSSLRPLRLSAPAARLRDQVIAAATKRGGDWP
jgi:hypothetical protein